MSTIAAQTRMGVVALSVADLARSLDYYTQQIGLPVLLQEPARAVLGVADTPLLELVELPGARPMPRTAGLYHFALLLPSRGDLARTIKHFADNRTPIVGASDHLVSEALYLSDPDGHGIEIYRDRPRAEWYDAQGRLRMDTLALDLPAILAELDSEPWNGLPDGTTIGHVHLQVGDVPAVERFYTQVLGFERMIAFAGAAFVSAGGYHHHLGLNSWAGRGMPPAPAEAARLLEYQILLPDQAALEATLARVRDAGQQPAPRTNGWFVRDPAQNGIVLTVA